MGHLQKIAIATAFEFQHNKEIAAELHRLKRIDLYGNIGGGLYGEVSEIGNGEMQIERAARHSRTGYPILFTFEE